MSAAELLEHAQAEGVALALVEGRLTWEANHEPPAELLEEIRSHRMEIIEALSAVNDPTPQAANWLARLAGLLACSPDYLLERGFVDRNDLAEQHQQHPRYAARLIRSHPDWHRDEDFRAQYAREEFFESLKRGETARPIRPREREPAQDFEFSDTAKSRDWPAARDAYHAHTLGNCTHCYPPLGRYCVTGSDLRARYLATPH